MKVNSLIRSAVRRLRADSKHGYDPGANRSFLRRNWNVVFEVPPAEQAKMLESVFEGTLDYVPSGDGKVHVLLCAQPKSASLYFIELLALSLGFTNHQIGFGRAGGAIYYPRLIAACFSNANTVSHCHSTPEPEVRALISNLGLQVVVLTRNLFDALVSRRDMLLKDGWAREMLSSRAIDKLAASSDEQVLDMIIDLYASSYANFAASWRQWADQIEPTPIFVTYDNVVNDPCAVIRQIAERLNLSISEQQVEQARSRITAAGGVNFNRGMPGRGCENFSPPQIERIMRLAQRLDGEGVPGFLSQERNSNRID